MALAETRIVVASMIQKSNMEVADRYDIEQRDRDPRDFYVYRAEPLPVRLVESE